MTTEKTTAVQDGLNTLKVASKKAMVIVTNIMAGADQAPDAIEARKVALKEMKKEELIDLIVSLEKPTKKEGIRVVDLITAIMKDEDCTPLTHDQVAGVIHTVMPDAKTTGKSVASIASKQGKDLGFLPRNKVRFNINEMMAALGV